LHDNLALKGWAISLTLVALNAPASFRGARL
jgi:hypothetical protein